jgi:Thiamine pyrophosphate enzyme, central domain
VFLALPMDVLDQRNTERVVASLPVRSEVRPDAGTIAETARLLTGARRPLILMGDGIAAADAHSELARVAELLGAPAWGANCSEVKDIAGMKGLWREGLHNPRSRTFPQNRRFERALSGLSADEKADALVVDQSVLVACLKVASVTVQSNQ